MTKNEDIKLWSKMRIQRYDLKKRAQSYGIKVDTKLCSKINI